MGISQSFVLYRQLLFYRYAFGKGRFMQSTLQETLYRSQVTRCGTSAVDFTAEGHLPRHLVLCKCWRPRIKPTRKRSGCHHGRILPPKKAENTSLHSSFPLWPSFSQLLLQEGLSGPSTHILWALLQPGKRMLLSQGLHASEDSIVLSQTPPWCPEQQFLWTKLGLLSYQDPGSISPSLVDNPQAEGLLHLGTGRRKTPAQKQLGSLQIMAFPLLSLRLSDS